MRKSNLKTIKEEVVTFFAVFQPNLPELTCRIDDEDYPSNHELKTLKSQGYELFYGMRNYKNQKRRKNV